jgi:hypothetical protein
MKKIILLCSFAILGVVATGIAQNITKAETPQITDTQNEAKIKFESETIDFGTIVQNEDAEREFKFTNIGSTPLVITKTNGSYGCKVLSWPKAPIAPGESSVIIVKCATNRISAFSSSVTIISNAINNPTKTIHIEGKVMADPATDMTDNDDEK